MSNTKTNYVKRHPNSWGKRALKLIAAIIILSSMLGLKNSSSIEHATFVIGLGIDISPTDPNKTLVTFQIVPPQITSQSSSDMDKVLVTSIDADSLETAVSLLHNYLSTVVNFSHTRVVVFGEEMAKKGVNKYINSLTSNPSYDTNMFVMVSTETAQKYLESISEDTEVNPSLYYNIIRNAQYISSSTQAVTLMKFLQSVYDPYLEPTATLCSITDPEKEEEKESKPQETQPSSTKPPGDSQEQATAQSSQGGSKPQTDTSTSTKPEENSESSSSKEESKGSAEGKIDNTKNQASSTIPQKSNAKIEVGGLAVFDGDKMVGSLTSNETAYYLMTTTSIKGFYTSVDHTGMKSDTVKTNIYAWQQNKPDIQVDVSQQVPLITIHIELNVSILDTESYTFDYYNTEYMNNMRENIENKLNKDLNSYLQKVQKEYQVDISNFAKYAKKSFYDNKSMEEYHWSDKYKEAKFRTSFQLNFVSASLSTKK